MKIEPGRSYVIKYTPCETCRSETNYVSWVVGQIAHVIERASPIIPCPSGDWMVDVVGFKERGLIGACCLHEIPDDSEDIENVVNEGIDDLVGVL